MNDMCPRGVAKGRDERGMALVGVLLLLLMMSALGAALTVNGQTETLIARNQLAAAQAQAAAEAGLSHGVEVTTDYIFDWKSNGFSSVSVAVDAVLANADAGTVNGLALNTPLTISAGFDAEYQVDIFDDDDNALGEDGDPLNDVNDVLVIRSTGTARDGTKVVLETLLSPLRLPSILINGDLELNGNASVEGTWAGVHANGNLTIGPTDQPSSVNVDGNASTAGDLDCFDPCSGVNGTITEGSDDIEVPDINASDYFDQADFVLKSDGTMTDKDGNFLCDASGNAECNGSWDWNAGQGTWSLQHSVTNGTYYVEGNVDISGHPGPANVSIIAEGFIDISGSPNFTPETGDLLFVTDEDLEINGTISGDEGQMLVRGQVSIHGNATLAGKLIVENEAVGDLVTSNVITGSAVISYSGSLDNVYIVTGWRDVRDAD